MTINCASDLHQAACQRNLTDRIVLYHARRSTPDKSCGLNWTNTPLIPGLPWQRFAVFRKTPLREMPQVFELTRLKPGQDLAGWRSVLGLERTRLRLTRVLPLVFCSGFNDKHVVMVLRCRIVVLMKDGADGWCVPHGEVIFPTCSQGVLHRERRLSGSTIEFLTQIAHRVRVFIDQRHQLY